MLLLFGAAADDADAFARFGRTAEFAPFTELKMVYCSSSAMDNADVGLSGSRIPFCTSSSRLARTDILRSRDLEVDSNFSLFFFLRHFQGLKSRPKALNLLFRSSGGVREPELRLFERRVAPFCFLVAITVLAATSLATWAAAGLTCRMSDSDSEDAISCRFSSKLSKSIELLRCGVTVIVTDFCIVSTL